MSAILSYFGEGMLLAKLYLAVGIFYTRMLISMT